MSVDVGVDQKILDSVDVGVDQKILDSVDVGVDVEQKISMSIFDITPNFLTLTTCFRAKI
jgi:hypothetical protein